MMCPHRVTHLRPARTTSATWGEVVAAAATIDEDVPALISPAGTQNIDAPYARIEMMNDTIFLSPTYEDGTARAVQREDLLHDLVRDEVWVVRSAGLPLDNPTTFTEGGGGTAHHIEVRVERADPETGVV